jgi:ABC-type multidrug transport system ATPase subunit
MVEADNLCDRVGVLVNGSLRCLGPSSYLKKTYGAGYQLELLLDFRKTDPTLKEREVSLDDPRNAWHYDHVTVHHSEKQTRRLPTAKILAAVRMGIARGKKVPLEDKDDSSDSGETERVPLISVRGKALDSETAGKLDSLRRCLVHWFVRYGQ